MNVFEPPSERERLARVYADMPDAALEDLASHPSTLTDVAREVLRNEIARRALEIAFIDSSPSVRHHELVTIRRFRDLPDALLAKSVLESAEIECLLADDIIIRMNWFWSYAMGQIKARVRDADAAASDELLRMNETPPAFIEFQGIGEYDQERCPNCGSFGASHDELLRVTYLMLFLFWLFAFVPAIPFRRRGWICHSCGHRWPDNEGH